MPAGADRHGARAGRSRAAAALALVVCGAGVWSSSVDAASPASQRRPAPVLAPPRASPSAATAALVRDGIDAYRRKELRRAEQAFRAALAADAGYLPPRLHLAAVLARLERYPEAADEAARALREAYVPAAREIEDHADLVILRAPERPERELLARARAEAARAWGAAAARGVPLLVRSAPALATGGAPGTYLLAPHQEIFSWSPAPPGGRFQQLTAEDGKVVGFARSRAGDRLLYVRAEKLVRLPGRPPVLRGVTVRVLRVPDMWLSPPLRVPEPATPAGQAPAGLELLAVGFAAPLDGARARGERPWVRTDAGLYWLALEAPEPSLRAEARAAPSDEVLIWDARVPPGRARAPRSVLGNDRDLKCWFSLREERAAQPARILVSARSPGACGVLPRGLSLPLPAAHGAALFVLPIAS